MPPRMVHQDLPHVPGRDSNKLRAAFPIDPITLTHEPDEGLVHQTRGLQGVARTFPPKIGGCEMARFAVHNSGHLLEGGRTDGIQACSAELCAVQHYSAVRNPTNEHALGLEM